jgi:hypothetical protein
MENGNQKGNRDGRHQRAKTRNEAQEFTKADKRDGLEEPKGEVTQVIVLDAAINRVERPIKVLDGEFVLERLRLEIIDINERADLSPRTESKVSDWFGDGTLRLNLALRILGPPRRRTCRPDSVSWYQLPRNHRATTTLFFLGMQCYLMTASAPKSN